MSVACLWNNIFLNLAREIMHKKLYFLTLVEEALIGDTWFYFSFTSRQLIWLTMLLFPVVERKFRNNAYAEETEKGRILPALNFKYFAQHFSLEVIFQIYDDFWYISGWLRKMIKYITFITFKSLCTCIL